MSNDTVHIIGIGGIGMSALAVILSEKGKKVSGSDTGESYITEHLKEKGIQVFKGHSKTHIIPDAEVVYSTAVKNSNPEYRAACDNGNVLKHRSELLKSLMEGYKTLLVTGTHGKTTTSGLLAHVLSVSGVEPCFAVGGFLKSLGTNGRFGKGAYFVAEADESDGSFLNYPAHGAIVTNIDTDHLDHWKTEENLVKGFQSFLDQVENKELVIWCYEDAHLRSLAPGGVSYGFSAKADARITSWKQRETQIVFDLEIQGKKYTQIAVFGMGKHTVLNATAVFTLCLKLGIKETAIKEAFASFKGMKRRVECIGTIKGACIYDDYGHHPTEIAATIKGLKQAFKNKRLIVVFEPHRFSRTSLLWEDFIHSFDEADEVVITDVYSAGEDSVEGISGERLSDDIGERTSLAIKVRYIPRKSLPVYFHDKLQANDLLLTLGAGSITTLGKEILALNI